MPDNILYSVQLPDGRTTQWSQDQYEKAKDNLFAKYPEANVVRTSAYNPEDTDINASDKFDIQLPDGRTTQWTQEQFSKAGSDLMTKYPDAKIIKQSDMNIHYWEPKMQEAKQRLDAFNSQHGKFMREYEFNKTLADSLEGEGVEQSGMHEYVASHDAEYQPLSRQREELRKAYYGNPLVARQYKANADAAESLRDDYRSKAEDADTGSERRDWKRAAKLQDDIQKLYNAPNKYVEEVDGSNGFAQFLKDYGTGAGDVLSDKDFWTRGFTEIARNIDILSISKKLQNAAISNKGNLSDEEIDRLLTPGEKAQIMSFYRLADAQKDRAENISSGYKSGSSFAESLGFMAEFLLSSGLANVAGKALSSSSKGLASWLGRELMSERALNRAIEKGVTVATDFSKLSRGAKAAKLADEYLAKPIVQGLWHTATQVSTARSISEALLETNSNGELVSIGHAFAKGLLDNVIENTSESIGGALEKLLALPFKGIGSLGEKYLGKTTFGRWSRWLYNAAPTQILKEAGFNGMIGEISEEWFGNAVRVGLGQMTPEEFKSFASWEQQLEMAASFAPMTLFGLGMSSYSSIRHSKDYDRLAGKVQDILQKQEVDQNKIDALFNTRFDTPEDIAKKFAPYLRNISADAQSPTAKEDYKTMLDFAKEVGIKTIVEEMDQMDRAEKRNDMRELISGTAGRFWQEYDSPEAKDADGNPLRIQQVRVVEYADGHPVYIVGGQEGLPGQEEGLFATVDESGKKGFIKQADIDAGLADGTITSDKEMLLDDYLQERVDATNRDTESQRMSEETRQQIAGIRQAVTDNPQFNIGTVESPIPATVVAMNGSGVHVVFNSPENGQGELDLTWKEVGDYLGTPISVKTDAEIEEDAAKARDEAKQRLDDIQKITPGTEITVRLGEGETAEDVKYPFQKATMDDGQIMVYYLDENGESKQVSEDMVVNLPELTELAKAEVPAEASEEETEETEPVEKPETPAVAKYTDANGNINRTAFQNNEPAEWAKWNDEQNNDGGADTQQAVNAKIKKLNKEIKGVDKKLADEDNPDTRETLKEQKSGLVQRLNTWQGILDGYVAREEAERQAAEAEAKRKERAEKVRERELNEPKSLQEVVSNWIATIKKGSLNKEDFKRETGLGETELKRFFPYWAKSGQGKTVVGLAESIAADDASGLIPVDGVTGQPDIQAVRDAIIDVMRSASKPSDIKNATREANLQREAEMESAYEEASEEEAGSESSAEEDIPLEAFIGYQTGRSEEVDQNGIAFVLSSDGTTTFGEVSAESGLPAAPIKLSEGKVTNNESKEGYGLEHIEARHGDEIRKAGFKNVVEFVEFVARNYDPNNIKIGKKRNDGSSTYLIQVKDQHNNTLFIELSSDGSYWNVNSGGVFSSRYGENKESVKPASAQQDRESVLDNTLRPSVKADNEEGPNGNVSSVSSEGKDNENSGNTSVSEQIEAARQDVDTNPSEAQKEAGNYKKGHVTIDGYNISIENPKGSIRRGTDSKGNDWQVEMQNDYGYIRMTEGVDGDHIDVFLSDNPTEGNVFVIDQVNPETGEFDEHKVMYGFPDAASARAAYLSNYSEGWQGLGVITEVTKDEFKKWIESSHRKTKPFSEYKSVSPISGQNEVTGAAQQEIPSTEAVEKRPEGTDLTEAQKNAIAFVQGKTVEEVEAELEAEKRAAEKEAKRQEKLRKRAEKWKKFLGDTFELLTGMDDINALDENTKAQVLAEMKKGETVHAWFNPQTGKVQIYLPNIKDTKMLDQKILHEVVSHRGLRGLFQNNEDFGKFCDLVWQNVMNEEARADFLNYVRGTADSMVARRAAADEFMAHAAEQNTSIVKAMDENVWTRIMDTLKNILNDMIGEDFFKDDLTWFDKLFGEATENYISEKRKNEQSVASAESAPSDNQKETKPKVRKGKDHKIDDFGQKIGGARKDMARERIKDSQKLTVKDLADLKDPDKILSRKQIAKYLAEGQMTANDATTLLAANMAARSASSGFESYKTLMLVKYRNLAAAWERGEDLAFEFTQEDEDYILSQYSERIQQMPDIRKKIRESLERHVKVVDDYKKTYDALDYPNTMRQIKSAYIRESRMDGRFWVVGGPNSYRGYPFATFDEAVIKMKRLYPEVVNADKEAKKAKDSGDSKTGHLKIVKDEYGWYRVKSTLIPGQIYLSKKFYNKNDAESYLNENAEALVEKELKMAASLMGSNIGMVQRQGQDYRGGKDVTEQQFMETFNPKGVEFGNWVPQAERQEYLNKTYDAIMDFCTVVGISPKAFFLGGRLGIAFGSRGHSGALAHYEPLKEVINLTRMKGAGSLAHEWFHALDNQLAKQKTGNTSDMATNTKNVVREEVANAFRDFVTAMSSLDYSKRSRRAGEYWGAVWERAARLFADYTYNELGGKGVVSPLLARQPDEIDETQEDFILSVWPYATKQENEAIKPYFDRLFKAIQEEPGTGVLFSKSDSNLKKTQFDIIQRTNPMTDDYHTGIRSIEDIKTWEEAVNNARKDAKEGGWDELAAYPDITNKMVEDALKSGQIRVFSSYPIANGVFVTPSRMNASDYAGGGEVYSKKVNVSDVAWINTDEGQFARPDSEKYSDVLTVAQQKAIDFVNGVRGREEARDEDNESVRFSKTAPNGQPSNLTDEQWEMVRTPEFKRWFGDWEKSARIEKLRRSDTVTVEESDYKGKYELDAQSAQRWILDNLRGEYPITDTGETVSLSRVGAEEVTSHSRYDDSHLKSISAIPKMLEKAVFIEEQPNDKGNKKFDSYRYYVVGLKIDGEDYTAKVVIGVRQGKKYYDHRLTQIEKTKLIDSLNQPVSDFTTAGSASLPPYISSKDSKLSEILQTDSSKVVDENGEPMVVYHGSQSVFNEFDQSKKGKNYGFRLSDGFYFTPQKETAEFYTTHPMEDISGQLKSVFLNIRNPLIVSGVADYRQKVNDLQSGLDVVSRDRFRSLNDSQKLTQTGYDGVYEKRDDGVAGEIVAFLPNQIKSADPVTYDDNGGVIPLSERFNNQDNDIRFSKTSRDLVDTMDKGGLKEVIGEENVPEFYNNIYRAIPEEIRDEIIKRLPDTGLDFHEAVRRHLADLAFNGIANDESGLLRFSGTMMQNYIDGDVQLGDRALEYVFWRAGKPAEITDSVDIAIDTYMRSRAEKEDSSIRFSKGDLAKSLEKAEASAANVADAARETLDEKKDKLRGDLLTLARAMNAQKEYDKSTVEALANLAKSLMKDQFIDTMNRREIGRLLGIVRTSVGKSPRIVKRNAQVLIDMVIDHLLKREKDGLKKITSITGVRQNASGVSIQGELDVKGQNIIKAYNKGIKSGSVTVKEGIRQIDTTLLDSMIADKQDELDSSNDAVRKQAEADVIGLELAKMYWEGVERSILEEQVIKDGIKEAKKSFEDGNLSKSALNQTIAAAETDMRNVHIESIIRHRELRAKIQQALNGSADVKMEFRDKEKKRIEHIHHLANSDMEGVPTNEPGSDDAFINGAIPQTLLGPLFTHVQFFKLLGRKNPYGKGYLYEYYVRKWRSAQDAEYVGMQQAMATLDQKVEEIFGEGKKFSDLFAISRSIDHKNRKDDIRNTMKFLDSGVMTEHDLGMGQLLYIYMVNKMSDGKMKLRRMGITEEQVEAIHRQLDERFVRFADWVQEEYLVDLRNRYNEVHERVFGASMAGIDNYFPLRIDMRDINREDDISNESTEIQLPSAITGSIINRTRNNRALDLNHTDALSVLFEHIQEMEHWAAYAEYIKDVNTLTSYRRFHNQLTSMNTVFGTGEKLFKNFRTAMKISAGAYRPKVSDAEKAANSVARSVATAKISLRLYTAMKQTASITAFMPDVTLKNAAKVTLEPIETWKWCMENLPSFAARWGLKNAGDEKLLPNDKEWKFLKEEFVKKLAEIGLTPNRFVDAVTVSLGARAIYLSKYDSYIQEGYSEEVADERAKQDAEISFNETQQSSENAFLSALQKDRTFVHQCLTVFRNSSFGFTRRSVEAVRNLRRMARNGYKEESIAFMTKQLVRDGLTEEQANTAAEKRYDRALWYNLATLATNTFMNTFLWNLSSHIIYLLFGDDDDKKLSYLREDALHALFSGWAEGFALGNVVSDKVGNLVAGESPFKFSPTLSPVMSDIDKLFRTMNSDPVAGINDLVNLAFQAGLGVNPQSITDAVVAVIDACNGDLDTSKEAMFLILRVMQVPQSQLEQLYIDEIGTNAAGARKMSYREISRRYAEYKVMQEAPLTGWAYSDEEMKKRIRSEEKTFKKKVNQRKESNKK